MNMKTKMGLVALCLLAAVAMTPSASAHTMPQADPAVVACVAGASGCGENHDSTATVAYSVLGAVGCVTTHPAHPSRDADRQPGTNPFSSPFFLPHFQPATVN